MNKDNSEEVDNRPYFSSYIQSMEIDPNYTEKDTYSKKNSTVSSNGIFRSI